MNVLRGEVNTSVDLLIKPIINHIIATVNYSNTFNTLPYIKFNTLSIYTMSLFLYFYCCDTLSHQVNLILFSRFVLRISHVVLLLFILVLACRHFLLQQRKKSFAASKICPVHKTTFRVWRNSSQEMQRVGQSLSVVSQLRRWNHPPNIVHHNLNCPIKLQYHCKYSSC